MTIVDYSSSDDEDIGTAPLARRPRPPSVTPVQGDEDVRPFVAAKSSRRPFGTVGPSEDINMGHAMRETEATQAKEEAMTTSTSAEAGEAVESQTVERQL
ncbi:hypothetical protein Nepgr_017271 [Nepenthes gracilis]|uniref:Uncharacterized protein n=1 Tax=Nepenthes gracilis TaxID=150966 RepID=A0AAD3SR53_NEPGR|nr:hypothetical protein Nepgr_017271 [Nepenthes gracilis]